MKFLVPYLFIFIAGMSFSYLLEDLLTGAIGNNLFVYFLVLIFMLFAAFHWHNTNRYFNYNDFQKTKKTN